MKLISLIMLGIMQKRIGLIYIESKNAKNFLHLAQRGYKNENFCVLVTLDIQIMLNYEDDIYSFVVFMIICWRQSYCVVNFWKLKNKNFEVNRNDKSAMIHAINWKSLLNG